MSTTIESLELEIQSSSTSAVKGIDALSASLFKLKNATQGGTGLTRISGQLAKLNTVLAKFDAFSPGKLERVVSSLQTLSSVGEFKLSPTIATQLEKIITVTSSMDESKTAGLEKLGSAIKTFNGIEKPVALKALITQLERLSKLSQALNGVNLDTFASRLNKVSDSLKQTSAKLNTTGAGFSVLPKNIAKAVAATNAVTLSNERAGTSYVNLGAKLVLVAGAFRKGIQIIGQFIHKSNEYIENLNLFSVSMGEYAKGARQYAENVSELMGIDPGDFMRNQGIFNTIITGFGVASDRAALMSKNLTQLGYDLSSLFNISYQDAMQKLQSGISGELEPLRRLGYDLSQASLKATALSLGITKTLDSMTQAEKSQLRYYAILKQVTVAQGDMARTLDAPSNQLRVLQAQLGQTARAIGNLFIPALRAVLPYAIAFVRAIRMVAQAIATFFKIPMPDFDVSGIAAGVSAVGDLSDNANKAAGGLGRAGKAAKELKNHLLGIDELNVISTDTTTGGAGGGGGAGGIGGGGFDFPLPEYDYVKDASAIVSQIEEKLTEIRTILAGFYIVLGTILVVSGVNIPLGIGLIALGAMELVRIATENWDAMPARLQEVLTTVMKVVSVFLIVLGLLLVFTAANIPLGIGLMVLGATMLGVAYAIDWKYVEMKMDYVLSEIMFLLGIAFLVIGALLLFTGVNIPLGIALMVAGAAALGSALAVNWDSMPPEIENVISTIMLILGAAVLALGFILLMTGVNIPLGIALLVAGAVMMVSAIAMRWDELNGTMSQQIKEVMKVAGAALLVIGLILAFSGINLPLGIVLIAAGATALAQGTGVNWGELGAKIKSVIKEVGVFVGAALVVLGLLLSLTGVAIPIGIGLIVAGAAALAGGVALNWDTMKEKFEGAFEAIKGSIGSAAKLAIGLMLALTGVGMPLGLALIYDGATDFATGKTVSWDDMVNKVKETLDRIAEEFRKFKDDPIKYMKEAAVHIIDGFNGSLNDHRSSSEKEVESWASSLIKSFMAILGIHSPSTVFYDLGTNTIDGFNNSIIEQHNITQGGITSWAEEVKTWFSGIANNAAFAEFAKNIIDGFKTKVGNTYTDTKDNITTWASNVKSWFTDSRDGSVNASTWESFGWDIIEGFKTKIGNKYGEVKSNVTTWATKVKDWFIDPNNGNVNKTAFGKYAYDTIDGFKNKIGNRYEDVRTNMEAWASNTKRWFSDIVSSSAFATFATDVIEAFKTKIGSDYTQVESNMKTFASSVKSWFTDTVSYDGFYNVASDVIDGFSKGIGNLYERTKTNINKWGSSIISWFEEKLDINSPSKVFQAIGQYVVQGFNDGIIKDSSSTGAVMSHWYNVISRDLPRIEYELDTKAIDHFNPRKIARTMGTQIQSNFDNTVTTDDSALLELMKEAMIYALNNSEMANDIRRQADKEEQTIVQIGNKTISDAVVTQQKADGYQFIR